MARKSTAKPLDPFYLLLTISGRQDLAHALHQGISIRRQSGEWVQMIRMQGTLRRQVFSSAPWQEYFVLQLLETKYLLKGEDISL